MGEDSELLQEQLAFYRRRAPEYDEWWQRRGPYDRGTEEAARWDAEVSEVALALEVALERVGTAARVLELAGGTGWWTQRLARVAGQLTVVDGAPETIELNRNRVRRRDIRYVEADIFAWEPEQKHGYDLVFFSFWLSHVPVTRFEDFWRLVRSCVAPGGLVFLIDGRRDPRVTRPDPYVIEAGPGIQRRRLSDGSEHLVVKVFYEPKELEDRLSQLGWDAELGRTQGAFVYGSARPRTID